jgi:hypothetical protein
MVRRVSLALFVVLAGCGRLGYDPLAEGAGGAIGLGGAGGGGAASGAGGTFGSGGASGAGGGGVDGSGSDGAGGGATCGQAGAPTQVWSFDTTVEGWELSGTGTFGWTGTDGDPSVGALQVDWSSGTVHPRLVQALGNLTGKIITMNVRVDAGSGVTAKLFVQTSSRLDWADGGLQAPTPGQWTCLALDLDNPVFAKQMYDPTDVQIVGLELDGMGSDSVLIDQVAY